MPVYLILVRVRYATDDAYGSPSTGNEAPGVGHSVVQELATTGLSLLNSCFVTKWRDQIHTRLTHYS